jgi:cyanophycinase
VATPEVPSGALVIIGGGGMPADITKKFVELGGGEKGRFVVFPTAMPDPLPPETFPALLKRFGVEHVDVISAREQAELEDPKNLEILEKATAIWFGGGRQWRFVDCYEGTRLHDLMRGVLKRGGVIAGSSAGATIQGDYLVRGAPAGPHIMMCEGYERGLGFLPGVAIDQHFTQRNRFADMTELMKTYPQYLGIGLDEATAIVVTGHTAEVMGRGKVHFYDRRKPVEEGKPDYEDFPAGTKYDLKERKALQ